MSEYRKAVSKIKFNKQVRQSGGYNAIPWRSLPKLSRVIPGVKREHYVIVTANSKVGKTQLADFMYVLEPYKFIKDNPDCGINLKIFYFSLEISKEKKMMSLLVNKIFNDTGEIIDIQNLNSEFEDYTLDDNTEELLDKYNDYFEELEKHITVIDNVRNPYGIFKYMENYAHHNGTYTKKMMDFVQKDGSVIQKEVNDTYVPNDPKELVIVITDSVNLLLPENGGTLHSAMSKFSSDYCLHMRDVWKYCVVNIQQQSAESEKQQFTMTGQSIVSKLRPSPDGLGDNKLTGRDANLILGLFAPYRYEIPDFNGYNITKLKDNYRELYICFNRDGGGSKSDNLLFNGAVNHFEEAPDKIGISEYEGIIKRLRK